MTSKKESATYIANVRVSIKHMASIAMFYNSQDEHKGTLSKLASAIIVSGAELAATSFPVENVRKAVEILQNLGYNDFLEPKAKHRISLFKALGNESKKEIKHDGYIKNIKDIMSNKTEVTMPSAEASNTVCIVDNKKPKTQMSAEEAAELTAKETTDVKSLRKAMKI